MTRRAPVLAAVGAVVLATAGCGATSQSAAGPKTGASATAAPVATTARRALTSSALSTAPSSSTTTPADYGSVDRSNPTAVARAAITANWTSDTTVDSRPFAATLRSLIWYTPAAAAKVRAHPPTGPAGEQWSTWAAHRATTTVTMQLDQDAGAPPDTSTVAYRSFEVTVTAHGQAGWTAPASHYQCFVTLTRTSADAAWQVAVFEVAQ